MAKKSTTRKSAPPQPSPLAAVLGHLVVPALEAEAESGDEGSSFDLSVPKSGEAPSIRAMLRGERLVHVLPMAIDDERTLLRFSLLSGYIISDCPSAVILLGNLLEATPFQIRTDYQLGLMGRLSIGCDVTVRADDTSLVRRRLSELLKLAEDLDWFMPLRLPHHLTWKDVNGLEIDWDDLPHNNLHGFLDDGMAVPPDERTPLTLLRVAQGLERWKDMLQLLRDHPDDFPRRDYAYLKCFAFRNLGRWLPAIRAAREGGIRNGRYPGREWISSAYTHSLIEAGDEIEALKILGRHQCGEPAYYDWLRGLALHRAGDREQAAACFQRYFAQWPSDIIGATKAALLDAEE
jgi:hypothetical protein